MRVNHRYFFLLDLLSAPNKPNLQQRRNLRHRSTIQKFLATLLLLVCTFSLLPKPFLHELIADHTDYYGSSSEDDATSFHSSGVICHCDDTVVSTAFVHSILHEAITLAIAPTAYLFSNYSCPFSNPITTIDLRGPPCFI